MRALFILFFTILHAKTAWALPSSLAFNPALKSKGDEVKTERGFQKEFQHNDIEILIRGQMFSSETVAKQRASIELANLLRLYTEHGNPYEGQISDLIKCNRAYMPQQFQFKVGEFPAAGLTAGTTDRKLFGACSSDQVGYWAAYFSFYYPPEKMVIEGRLFKKTGGVKPADLKKLNAELQSAAREVLTGINK